MYILYDGKRFSAMKPISCMRQNFLPCLHIVLLCILSANVSSQTLDWSSSFSSAWADGATSSTANNVAPGVNLAVTITNSQAGTYQNAAGATPTPSVNSNNGRSGC